MLGLNKTIINGIETVDVVEYARATNQKTKDIKEKFESKLIKKYSRFYLPSVLLEELRGVVVIVKGTTPVSVNSMYHGNHMLSDKYQKFIKEMGKQVRAQLTVDRLECIDFTRMLNIEVIVNPGYRVDFKTGGYTTKDLDNLLKSTLDVLFKQLRGITSIGCLDDKMVGEISIKLNKDIDLNDKKQIKEEGFQIRITNSERVYTAQTEDIRLSEISEQVERINKNKEKKLKKCS